MKRFLVLLTLSACTTPKPAEPTWPKTSTISVSDSARCGHGTCTCRPLDGGDDAEGHPPPEGTKRYELRLGETIDPTWIEVEGKGVFVHESEGPQGGCVYVDLPIGKKAHVRYHVEAHDRTQGVALAFAVAEYGVNASSWYPTASVKCDAPCDKAAMEEWLAKVHALDKGILDPCGSTKIFEANWTTPPTDLPHPVSATVDFALQVYKFAPKWAHGSEECKKKKGGAAAEE